MQLATNFHISEFCVSETAARYNIDNSIPNDKITQSLKLVAEKVLQPTRDYFKKPLIITSGYRCAKLNTMILGSKTSQHIKGEAVDFYIPGVPHYDVANWIKNKLSYDQLILEFDSWIHVSYTASKNRKECLTINKKGTFPDLIK